MENFRDTARSFKERAADLCARMTLEEKITYLGAWTAPIPRLGIPAHHFANEASHGINALNYVNANKYNVTSFPVCLAMGQSWDREKIKKVTAAISDEIRAVHNMGNESLSFWCPTINLSKDPRNGRSDENFGEDPYLGGKMAASYIQGFQGDDPKYVKAANTPKHYMLNSSENNRNTGISFADERTIREYYARVFEYAFREGKAESVMISYNRINGVPAGASRFAMEKLLREEWGFDGYVTSDCGAVAQSFKQQGLSSLVGTDENLAHFYYNDMEEACAGTVKAGLDLSCGAEHRKYMKKALERGLLTEDDVDRAVIRNLTSLFRQGLFDPKGSTPWDGYGPEHLCCDAHHELAVDMANDTIVLLKNEKGLLPIQKKGLKKVLVVGPNAKFRELGGYSAGGGGVFSNLDTLVDVPPLAGVIAELADTDAEVVYEKGWTSQKENGQNLMDMLGAVPGVQIEDVMGNLMGVEKDQTSGTYDLPPFIPRTQPEDPDYRADDQVLFDRALEQAKDADLVIFVAGTDSCTASEGTDRESIQLPKEQGKKLEQMLQVNPNTVAVLVTMGTIGDPALDQAHTLVLATYAGEAQGTAIANVLFGKVNPNGKLTATWYKDDSQLPHINDYGIRKADVLTQSHGRTYWYFDETPRFPFGYGLSYTTFSYDNLRLEQERIPNGGALRLWVDITNTGSVAGKEIAQLYVTKVTEGEKPGVHRPIKQLKAFEKISLEPGQTKTVEFTVPLRDITFWNYFYEKMAVEPGSYQVAVGPNSADAAQSAAFEIVGEWDAPLSTVFTDLDKYVYASGETGKIRVSATLEDTTSLKWEDAKPVFSSSDPAVAVVSQDGTVTAVGAGSATITTTVVWKGVEKTHQLGVAVRA